MEVPGVTDAERAGSFYITWPESGRGGSEALCCFFLLGELVHSTLLHCTGEVYLWLFFNVNLQAFKGKLTNSYSLFNSSIKCLFPRETS